MQRTKSYWHKFKFWWKGPLVHSFVACIFGLGLFFLISIPITCWCWEAFPRLFGFDSRNAMLATLVIGGVIAPIGTIVFAEPCWHWLEFYWGENFKPWWVKNRLTNSFITFGCALILLLLITMLTCKGGIVTELLGTTNKKDTIEFIAYGIGGTLGLIGTIALSFRADAQTINNKLIEQGHINERFKSATENLGHNDASVRIASFYQFYYLAKEGGENFRRNIFEILCSRLRSIPKCKSHTKEDGRPTAECQTLLNILFHPKYQPVFNKFKPDLRRAYLAWTNLGRMSLAHANLTLANLTYSDLKNTNLEGADLTRANLEGADLTRAILVGANLTDVDFKNVLSIKGADFRWAEIGDRPITKDDIPADKGEYYADWNPSPEKEEN